MASEPLPLDVGALRAALLPPAGRCARVELVCQTGSTNADLVSAAGSPDAGMWPDLSVLCAEEQSSGRGRMDRTWTTPPGSSVIVSVLLRPDAQQVTMGHGAYAWMSMLAAVALMDALDATAGIEAELKWPNDVLIAGRKVSGILAQLVPPVPGPGTGAGHGAVIGAPGVVCGTDAGRSVGGGPAVVVGTGINVSQTAQQLPVDTATSLALEGAATLDRNILLPAYLQRFAELYGAFCAGGGNSRLPLAGGKSLLQLVSARMVTLGCQVRVELPGARMLHGEAAGMDAAGSLLVTDAAGTTHAVSAGDVVHLRRQQADGTVRYA